MNSASRSSRPVITTPVRVTPRDDEADRRLRVLIHEMSNLIDGSMRSLSLVRSTLDAPEEPAAQVAAGMSSDTQLEHVATSLEQMADLLRNATAVGQPHARIRSNASTLIDLVERVSGFMAPSATERGIRIATSVCTGAAALDAPPIESVLINVVRNSIEAIGRTGQIEIMVQFDDDATDGRRLVILVLDDGCGPPHRAESRVFEPGFSTRPDGSGIGLALSRDLIEDMGGTITIAERWSTEAMGSDGGRRGARVEIRLPL